MLFNFLWIGGLGFLGLKKQRGHTYVKSKTAHETDFNQPVLSDDEIIAKIAELDAQKKKFKMTTGLGTGMSVLLIILLLPLIHILLPLLIVGILILSSQTSKRSMAIKQLISDNIIRRALSEVMVSKRISCNSHISRGQISGTNLIEKWSRCSGSDLVEGIYRGVNIAFSDIHLEQEKGDDNQTVTKFKGQWLIADLAKDIRGEVCIRERDPKEKLKSSKSDIETENIAFNQKYQIKTSDPHTAFLILTPHFMDYINSMDAKARAMTSMCFTNMYGKSQVHIALHNNRDLFEFNLHQIRSVGDLAPIRAQIQREIFYITSVIDELLLNEYLFKKEN